MALPHHAQRALHPYMDKTREGDRFAGAISVGLESAPLADAYHRVLTCRWSTFFGVTAVVFLLINAVFGGLYVVGDHAIVGAKDGSYSDAFFFSVQTIATIGYGGMMPASLYAHVLVTTEALLGIFSTALITGITFAKFSRPTSRVLFSKRGVIVMRDGVPHLAFRMANQRQNRIVEAQLRVITLLFEKTSEGETLRRPVELPLLRDRNAVFSLSWLALHKIDEASPFWGYDTGKLEQMKSEGTEVFLALSGTDETTSQTVHSRYAYLIDDIVMNARFVDVLEVLPDGTRLIDYRKFHDIEPQVNAEGKRDIEPQSLNARVTAAEHTKHF